MSIADEKYLALTTFTRDGRRKSTPIWIADVGSGIDGDLGFTTGDSAWKLKRLRNDSRCELQACNSRGAVVEGSVVATGRGREAAADEMPKIRQAIKAKYGFQVTMINAVQKVSSMIGRNKAGATTGIVITLD